MIPAVLAFALATAPQAGEPPLRHDPEIVFARGSQGGWSMEGRTAVREGYTGRPGIPATESTIRGMYCFARRRGIQVSIRREGGLGIDIQGSVTEEGRERRLRAFDLRAFVLDGTAFQVQTRSRNDFTERFTDAAYAEPELGPSNVKDRQLGVRRAPGVVWLPISTLADDLLHARMLRLGFREEVEDPDAWDTPMIWIDVPLDGLGDALSWCRMAMASPNALRFHPAEIPQPPAPIRR
jgi:hypothetical protein